MAPLKTDPIRGWWFWLRYWSPWSKWWPRKRQKEKLYRYQDQTGAFTLTRSEILQQYYAWWSSEMKRTGNEKLISEDACVEDWCVVHWAWEVHDRR